MKSVIISLFLLFSLNSSGQRTNKTKPDNRFVGLDTTFNRVLKEWRAAGFAVAVVEKGKIIYAKGFGYKDYETKAPVTVNTQFAIGSCTKAFTAAILGILKQNGKIDFDNPLHDYLPEIKFSDDNLTYHVTLRDMMTHRTGIPRYDFSWYLWPSENEDSLIKRIQYFKPTYPLRAQWQYNNWMYFLQGVVGEKITGASWHKNLQELILNPLGMTHTNSTKKDHESYGDNAVGYTVKRDSIIERMDFYNIAAMAPAGSINSTVMDMSKWISVWLNQGKYDGKEILPPSYIDQAKSSQMVIDGALPQKEEPGIYFSNYGYGWFLASYRGHYRAEHGGNIDGFSASVSFFPSDSIGIVVLVNQNASSVPSVVRNILSDRVLKLPYKDWQTTLKSANEKAKKAEADAKKEMVAGEKPETHPSHPLRDYEGDYSNPGFGNISITLKKDSLFAHTPSQELYLRHANYDVFDLFGVDKKDGLDTTTAGPKVQFYLNEAGEIQGLRSQLEASQPPIKFNKNPSLQPLSPDSLRQYTGTYDLGIEIKIYTKADGKLYMLVPNQPEYELQYVGDDRFIIKSLSGYHVQFERDQTGTIIAAVAQQPNGNFRAKKK